MRLLIAAIISGFIGIIQLCVIVAIEASRAPESDGPLLSGVAFLLFAVMVAAEIFCVITMAMYRITPWILYLMRDGWEADRIQRVKQKYATAITLATTGAVLARRVVVAIDSRSFDLALLLSLFIGLVSILVPKLKPEHFGAKVGLRKNENSDETANEAGSAEQSMKRTD